MKKSISLLALILLLFTFNKSNAQTTIAKLKYEQAEEAFAKNDYQTTLSKLEETEKILGDINPKILYLRIQAQHKLIEQNPLADYKMLESARKNCTTYLKNYENKVAEEKYKEIYLISEDLAKHPKTAQEFESNRQAKIKEEAERKWQAEEKKRKEEEERKRLEAERIKEETEKIKRSASILSFQGGTVARYGISFDRLVYKGVGGFVSGRIIYRSSLSRNDLRVNNYWFTKTGEMKPTKFVISGGLTFPIFHPLSGYAGIGMGGLFQNEVYKLYTPSSSSPSGFDYIKDDLVVAYTKTPPPFFENSVGLILRLGPVFALKSGLSWSNFKNPEVTYGVGINLAKKKL